MISKTISTLNPKGEFTSTPSDLGVDDAELQGLQIHFVHPWTGDSQRWLAVMVDQFNQNNEWGIHVIMDSPGSAGFMTQTLWTQLDEGTYANVVAAPISLLLAVDEKEKLVVDLNTYIESAGYGLSQERYEDFNKVFWNEDNYEGKQYAVPAQRSAVVMIYNTTWAGELGFKEPPSTPEEFNQQACAANASMRKDMDYSNDGLGGWIINTSSPILLNWLMAFNTEIFRNGNITFKSNETDEAFTYLHNLWKQSCAWASNYPQPYDYFAKRQSLVYSGQLQDVQVQQKRMGLAGSQDEWKVLPFPGIDGNSVITSGYSYAVLHTDSLQDLAAWLFIRWLSEPEQQARLLNTFGTLPLGQDVMSLMTDYSNSHPQWTQAQDLLDDIVILPETPDWNVISPALEDAGWQLFNAQTKAEQIGSILEELDSLVKELSERYP